MGAVFIIAEMFKETLVLDKLLNKVVGLPSSFSAMLFRFMLPVILTSSICSNSALTTLCIPILTGVCERVGKWDMAVGFFVRTRILSIWG